jgi:hypothetical protein
MHFIFFAEQTISYSEETVCFLAMIQLSDLFLFTSNSSIVALELGKMRNGVLYPMDPIAQPIQFQSDCWKGESGQETFHFGIAFAVQIF